MNFIDRFFKISERGSTARTEIVAGITTFAAMSYIIAVNPIILSQTGMDRAGLMSVTVIATVISTLFMGLYSNLPIAAAPANTFESIAK